MQVPTVLTVLAASLLSFTAAGDDSLYTCARDLALVHYNQRALGPIFFEENIAFTSAALVPGDSQKMFIVLTDNQVLATPINDMAIQRMFFRLNGSSYYVGYMHGEILGNRYFEFSRNAVPDGKTNADYRLINLKPAPQLTEAVIGLMDNQLDQVLHDLSDGGLQKSSASKFELGGCQKITATVEAAELHHKVDVFRVWTQSSGGNRLPASTGNFSF